ncbi:hypothetical protein [Dyella mobilis]|uniref:Sel1 repeat family protein n=1 Tax=Dyella mobilis TaxID=1849582 RepID=A0ABS2KC94_9GAMM|nr:hypothetical protein [Dyella mobilis]MBM7128784.1 hypothetical protein [Dyella mobilis]
MDTLFGTTKAPANEDFLRHSRNDLDPAQMQVFLWYVYRNPTLSGAFFSKVDPTRLLNDVFDPITSILWLMKKKGGYFGSMQAEDRDRLYSRLDRWKKGLVSSDKFRNLLLDLYADDHGNELEDETQARSTGNDVDVDLRLGVISDKKGEKLEALYYYTKSAEYGYQGALVGASLLLVQVAGDKCTTRSAYYAVLSGAMGPIDWLGRNMKDRAPFGSPSTNPF